LKFAFTHFRKIGNPTFSLLLTYFYEIGCLLECKLLKITKPLIAASLIFILFFFFLSIKLKGALNLMDKRKYCFETQFSIDRFLLKVFNQFLINNFL